MGIPFKEFQRGIAAEEILTQIRSISEQDTRGEIFASIPLSSKELNAAYRHELEHLRRQPGTTYGLMLRAIHDGAIRKMLAPTVEVVSARSDDVPFPMANRLKLDSEWKTSIQTGENWPTVGGRWNEFGLEGQTAAYIQAASAFLKYADTGFGDVPTLRAAGAFLNLQFPNETYLTGFSDAVSIRDHVMLPEERLSVGAESLFEFSAVMEEFSWHGHLAGDTVAAQALVRSKPVYGHVMAQLSHAFGINSVGTGQRVDDFATPSLTLFPVEAYALLDVALMPPFVPEGLHERRTWQLADLSPNVRFVLLMAWYQEQYGVKTSHDAEGRDSAALELQRRACQYYDWPEPTELAARWFRFLRDDAWFDRGPFVGMREDLYLRNARTALGLRLKRPYDWLVNNIEPEGYSEIRWGVWLAKDGDDLNMKASGSGTEPDPFWKYTVGSLIRWALFGGTDFRQLQLGVQGYAVNQLKETIMPGEWLVDTLHDYLGTAR